MPSSRDKSTVDTFVNEVGVPVRCTVGAVIYPSPISVKVIAVITPELNVKVAVACTRVSPDTVLVGALINTISLWQMWLYFDHNK